LLAATSTQAGFSESFNYATSSSLIGQGGWTNVSGSGSMTIVDTTSNPLAVGSVNGGNSALRLSGSRVAQKTLAPTTTAPVIVSFLLRYNSSNPVANNDFASIIFSDTDLSGIATNVPNIGLKANEEFGPETENDFFIRFSGTSGIFADLNLVSGTEYLITGTLFKGAGSSTYNEFELSVTDGITTKTASGSQAAGTGISSISRIGIRGGNLNNNVTVDIDNLNVNVVPVPPALALVVMGVGPLAGWHFLRRRKTAAA
jgi:hypothetical protein